MPRTPARDPSAAPASTVAVNDSLAAIVADPLDSLAEAVAVEIERQPGNAVPPGKGGHIATRRRSLKSAIAKALRQKLQERSAEGKAIRMALIVDLATSERAGPGRDGSGVTGTDPLLTTASVAELLEVSRPYVAMLCDQGSLGQVDRTEGGHRRIRRSAVEAYQRQRARLGGDAVVSPRQAGVEAGLYEYPDQHYALVDRVQMAEGSRKRSGKGRK